MASSARSRITWHGFHFYLLLGVAFLMLLKITSRLKKMSTINNIYKDVFLKLLAAGFTESQSKILVAQAAHETANFTSDIFRNNNNLFGMKFPHVRDTLAIAERRGHAVYKDIDESIKDFAIYYKNFAYLSTYSTVNAYIEAIAQKKYFEANIEEYKTGVNHFYKLYFNGRE